MTVLEKLGTKPRCDCTFPSGITYADSTYAWEKLTRTVCRGGSKQWPGEGGKGTRPCELCPPPCGPHNETGCKVPRLHNSCIYSVASATSLHLLCVELQQLPQQWKDANIITISKRKGDRAECGNSRGISPLGRWQSLSPRDASATSHPRG